MAISPIVHWAAGIAAMGHEVKVAVSAPRAYARVRARVSRIKRSMTWEPTSDLAFDWQSTVSESAATAIDSDLSFSWRIEEVSEGVDNFEEDEMVEEEDLFDEV